MRVCVCYISAYFHDLYINIILYNFKCILFYPHMYCLRFTNKANLRSASKINRELSVLIKQKYLVESER